MPKPIQTRSLANSPWPMFRHNLNHTGLSPYDTSANHGDLLWNYSTSGSVASSPAIGSDGTIYVGSDDYNLYAINPNGTKKWNFTTGGDVRSSPAIGSDGTIYVGSNDYNLYAIYPNGTKKWNFTTGGIESSPAIGSDGTVYVGGSIFLYAIYTNGTLRWKFKTNDIFHSSPAIAADNTIYIGSWDTYLYAIYPDGTLKWKYKTANEVYSSPAIGADGTIYIGIKEEGFLYAINPIGTFKWKFTIGYPISSSPAVGADGTIYVGNEGWYFYAINPDGTKKWNFTTGNCVRSSPAIGSDGTIYVGCDDGNLYAINPNGTKKWNFTTGGGVYSSPAIGSDGTIYVGSTDGKLYAIGITSLILSSGIVKPLSGFTNTFFNYSVNYLHKFNKPPVYVYVNIDGINYTINETDTSDVNYVDGKNYYFNITHLNIGVHNSKFWASDGINITCTRLFNKPIVYNTPPNITTEDNLTAIEEVYYEVNYEYEDIDIANVGQFGHWNFSTNASWLAFNPTTALLNGTPTNDDVRQYWVNITINDTMDINYSNFTLTVIDINDDPIITTPNTEITYEDAVYYNDYNATDIDSPIEAQIWYLETNASLWLDIDSDTGLISGIPTNDDIGWYWVNVSVNDTEGGLDFTNFTLIVLNVNDPPEIITNDVTTAIVDEFYNVDYEAIDIDPPPINLVWSLNTNATWLDINSNTGILSGTATISDLGWYNVNVTVQDGDGGEDWHEFILTVTNGIETENEPPFITTTDVLSATVNTTYLVDYEAIDDHTPVGKLLWSLETNASWLNIDENTGVISGTPTELDVGRYWVNISVIDGEGGWDYHDFILTVTTEPIEENNALELSDPKITPSEGNTETEFTFSVHYYDADNDIPTFIQVVIDNNPYNMTLTSSNPANGAYEYSTELSEGTHTYYFTASDGIDIIRTENFTVDVNEASKKSEESYWFGLIWIIIVIIIVFLILLFIFLKRKKSQEAPVAPAVSQPISVGEPIMEEEMEE
ncbi:MAG: PQQ-binding-like beta-propeller repeat protein [Thermoplasmata archaeon]|nr:PQQ-binding-like beta-propeller repeat protein [Thermoplasmata archaeon]